MPLYEYECQKCHRKTEKIEKVDGPHLKKCPHCSGKVERMISRTSMQFKGTGWYVTDYASKAPKADGDGSAKPATTDSKESSTKEASGDSSTKDGKDTATKESSKDSGKESKKSEEKKPAKKK